MIHSVESRHLLNKGGFLQPGYAYGISAFPMAQVVILCQGRWSRRRAVPFHNVLHCWCQHSSDFERSSHSLHTWAHVSSSRAVKFKNTLVLCMRDIARLRGGLEAYRLDKTEEGTCWNGLSFAFASVAIFGNRLRTINRALMNLRRDNSRRTSALLTTTRRKPNSTLASDSFVCYNIANNRNALAFQDLKVSQFGDYAKRLVDIPVRPLDFMQLTVLLLL